MLSVEQYLASRTPEERLAVSEHCLRAVREGHAYRTLAGMTEGKSVLDVGCAGAEFLEAVERWRPGTTYCGLERFQVLLEIGQRRRPDADLRQVASYMELPDGFDTIVLRRFLVHTPEVQRGLYIERARQQAGRAVLVGWPRAEQSPRCCGEAFIEGDMKYFRLAPR